MARGQGVNDEDAARPRRRRLKKLARSTIESRTRRGVPNPGRSVGRDTGQMLDALKGKGRQGFFEIDVERSGRRGSPQNNRDVSRFYSKDRPWLALTGREQDELVKLVDEKVRALIKRFL